MLVNTRVIKSFNPCESGLRSWVRHYNSKQFSLLDFLNLPKISDVHKVWLTVRLMPHHLVEVFAIDCAFSAVAYASTANANANAVYAAVDAATATATATTYATYATYAADAAAYAAADAAAYAAADADAAAADADAAAANERENQVEILKWLISQKEG